MYPRVPCVSKVMEHRSSMELCRYRSSMEHRSSMELCRYRSCKELCRYRSSMELCRYRSSKEHRSSMELCRYRSSKELQVSAGHLSKYPPRRRASQRYYIRLGDGGVGSYVILIILLKT